MKTKTFEQQSNKDAKAGERQQLRPLGMRVFIRPEILTQSAGGLHLPQCRVDMPNTGTIVAVANKATADYGLKVGDRVLFDRHYQTLSEDQETTIIEAQHVLAILES